VRHAISLVLILVVASPAAVRGDESIQIDITPERERYEAMSRSRNLGLALLGGTLTLGGLSALGWSQAYASRNSLQAQTIPVNVAQRQDLASRGRTGNAVGIVSTLLCLGTGALSAYFLTLSF
jgi:hypothetical protein